MLAFANVEAEIIKLNLVAVRWTTQNSDEDIGFFRFKVLKSFSPQGPFEAISGELINLFMYFDSSLQMKSSWRKVYYKIAIRDARNDAVVESEVVGLDSEPDLILLEVRRRHDLYLRRYVGVPAAVLISRSFGQRCPNCFDQVKQRVRSSACLVCFATGFVGGYLAPINCFINFSPSPELVQLIETGETHPNQTNMWTGSFPELSPRDMIVEFPVKAEQKRWRVVTVGRTERLRTTSRQIAQVTEINRNDVEYKLEVPKFVPPKDVFLGFRPPDGSGLL
jgi:hypothetical protein